MTWITERKAMTPGRAVGPSGAFAAGTGSVDGGPPREFLDLRRVGGALGYDERAEHGGLERERIGGAVRGHRAADGRDGEGRLARLGNGGRMVSRSRKGV